MDDRRIHVENGYQKILLACLLLPEIYTGKWKNSLPRGFQKSWEGVSWNNFFVDLPLGANFFLGRRTYWFDKPVLDRHDTQMSYFGSLYDLFPREFEKLMSKTSWESGGTPAEFWRDLPDLTIETLTEWQTAPGAASLQRRARVYPCLSIQQLREAAEKIQPAAARKRLNREALRVSEILEMIW